MDYVQRARETTVPETWIDSLEDPQDRELLRADLEHARAYVDAMPWRTDVVERRFACGMPGAVSLFLFAFDPPVADTDSLLWIISGDIPTAHISVDHATQDPFETFECYCELMTDWCAAAASGEHDALARVFPIDLTPSPRNADILRQRIDAIRTRILPMLREGDDWGRCYL